MFGRQSQVRLPFPHFTMFENPPHLPFHPVNNLFRFSINFAFRSPLDVLQPFSMGFDNYCCMTFSPFCMFWLWVPLDDFHTITQSASTCCLRRPHGQPENFARQARP